MQILNKIKKAIFFIFIIIYEEIIFSIIVFKQFPTTIILIILFSIPIGILFDLLTSCLKTKVNKIISYIITIITSIIFIAQFIYNKIFQSLISMHSLKNGKQAFQFYETILEVMRNNFLVILAIVLPIIILIVLHKFRKIDFEKKKLKEICIEIALLVLIQVIATLSVSLKQDEDIYSNEEVYYNSDSLVMKAKRFGVFTTMRLDIKKLLFKNDETLEVIAKIIKQPIEALDECKEYNKLDIDFNNIVENDRNADLELIDKYMSVQKPSEKNEYTGMFKDKNLVVIVAESLSNIGIREDTTPTLYKLSKEGFEFKNFYNPLFPVSTADGEYMIDNSLLPKEGVWSISEVAGNYMPYSYANVFKRLGYSANAYHNHTSTYYNRDKYMPTMGYDSFLAVETGLEERMNIEGWPASDLDMIKVTTDDYINNDRFLAYYMTLSGHLGYTRDGNVMAVKNWNLVENLPYSEKAKGYLAAQAELDKAVEYLIQELDNKGILEDTVIVISGDHYPYGLELDEVNELSTYKRDENFEVFNMPLIIWSASMKEPIVVEKLGSSLDILPTVLNLFGIEYDSRLLMGRDILSNSEPLVMLANRSFITEFGKYNSITGEFIKSTESNVDKEYINRIKTIIEGKFQISKLILEQDYYNSIKECLSNS